MVKTGEGVANVFSHEGRLTPGGGHCLHRWGPTLGQVAKAGKIATGPLSTYPSILTPLCGEDGQNQDRGGEDAFLSRAG